MLQDMGSAALGADSEEFKKLQDSLSSMSTVYSSTRIKDQNSNRLHPLDPDLTAILVEQSTIDGPQCAYEKQKYYWDEWNTNVGTACIDDYAIFVEMSNAAAEANGYTDTGESWRARYEDDNFRENLEAVWSGKEGKRGVKQLYQKLHGYIRYFTHVSYVSV